MYIKTPDIGVDKATVAEILVKVGDCIAVDDSVVLLESDKASVEVPSTTAGIVKSISVSLGDEVNEGTVLIELEAEDAASAATEGPDAADAQKTSENTPTSLPDQDIMQELAAHTPKAYTQSATSTSTSTSTSASVEVKLPDIGVEKALVGEILVKVGDKIDVDQSIMVVESDKATVEVPSSVAGIVQSVAVHEGDSVKEGVLLLNVTVTESNAPAGISADVPKAATQQVATSQAAPVKSEAKAAASDRKSVV